jgi:hypothetical protein
MPANTPDCSPFSDRISGDVDVCAQRAPSRSRSGRTPAGAASPPPPRSQSRGRSEANARSLHRQRFLSPGSRFSAPTAAAPARGSWRTWRLNKFEITKLGATQAGAALIVRYFAEVEGVVNGKPCTPGPAPRLSVFVFNGKRWLLAAHANFNPLSGE